MHENLRMLDRTSQTHHVEQTPRSKTGTFSNSNLCLSSSEVPDIVCSFTGRNIGRIHKRETPGFQRKSTEDVTATLDTGADYAKQFLFRLLLPFIAR